MRIVGRDGVRNYGDAVRLLKRRRQENQDGIRILHTTLLMRFLSGILRRRQVLIFGVEADTRVTTQVVSQSSFETDDFDQIRVSSSPGHSAHQSFSLRPSPQYPSYSWVPFRYEPTECSNCKVKDLKINKLKTRIKILEARLELERHPEDHACPLGVIFYELKTRIKILEARLELERHPEDHACPLGVIFYELLDITYKENNKAMAFITTNIPYLLWYEVDFWSLILGLISEPTKCSNFKVKDLKINMLKTRIKILEARLELQRQPEDQACQLGALHYELLDDLENLRIKQ
ncbi:hypothetical protein Tco_0289854 [Tanacetum coccineum]